MIEFHEPPDWFSLDEKVVGDWLRDVVKSHNQTTETDGKKFDGGATAGASVKSHGRAILQRPILRGAHRAIDHLSFSFLDDHQIQSANEKFLSHPYPTDIITFDYSEDENLVGEILIGFETVAANAGELQIPKTDEMCRVLAHGVLHLLGFDDQTESQQIEMRKAEEKALLLRPEILKGKN